MKHIVSLAFSQDNSNFDEEIDFLGERFRITEHSTNFDVGLTESLIKKYDGVCDVICITGLPPKFKFKKSFFIHPQTSQLKTASNYTPIVDGQIIKDVYIPYALRMFYLKNKNYLTDKRIAFYSGALQRPFVEVLEDLDNEIILADPFFLMKLPFTLHSTNSLDKFIKALVPILSRMKIKKSHIPNFSKTHQKAGRVLEDFFSADIFVSNEAPLDLMDLSHLKNKTLIIDLLTPGLEKKLKDIGLKEALVCLPQLSQYSKINYGILEGIILLRKGVGEVVKEDDVIKLVDELKLCPEIKIFKDNTEEVVTFAFIVHPLSRKHLFKHPLLKNVKKYSKPFEKIAEEVIANFPGYYYGKIENIISAKNGQKVKGLVYMVPQTPKKLMEANADAIYKNILKLCEKARINGAKIIGLGAYTKIVGDAGVTIARLSPIPVTTGNSLSAATTLWAAKLAILKLDFVKQDPAGTFLGKVMIVGATGSIGAVSAKVLALSWQEIILVAPRAYKLIELKEEILKINPDVKIEISTDADNFSAQADLIITTTSGQGKTVLDIMKVKAGAVICDVSRPFDITAEEAVRRPDVMVIASGEVELPGEVKMKIDIGLEGNLVYACLAETAILAMEGKFESFTLSRNINFEKVIEIDRLAIEHGVRLSEIMGHNGVITKQEFDLCREHAIKKRANK
jgi:predicted amino acid dehydrogenase